MKKLLISALAIAMGITCVAGIVACTDPEKPGETLTDAEIAKKAIQTVDSLYKDGATSTPIDYKVIGQTKIGDNFYDINWSVSTEMADITLSDYVTVGTELDASKQITIAVNAGSIVVDYTLTASVTVGKATETASYSKSIPAKAEDHAGTLEDPFMVANVIEIAAGLESGKYYSDADGNLLKIYARGYVVDVGYESKAGGAGVGRLGNVYIVDEYSEDKDKTSEGALQVYTLTYDDTYVTNSNSLMKGDLITLWGWIENYGGKPEITYDGGSGTVTCVAKVSAADSMTDAEKVAAAEAAVTLSATKYAALGEYDLPAALYGTTYAWAISENDYVAIENGKLVVKALPEAATELTLTLTITAGEESATKEFKISVTPLELEHAGTEADPYSVADVYQLFSTLASGATMPDEMYVAGYITDPGKVYKEFMSSAYIKDENGTQTLQLYTIAQNDLVKFTEDGETPLAIGDYVVIRGWLKNYNGTAEIDKLDNDNVPEFVKWEQGKGDPTNYGTLKAPLTVTEALALAANQCANDGDVTAQIVYMKGVVAEIGKTGNYYSNVYIAEEGKADTKVLVYTINMRDGVTAPQVGDSVVISGYIKNYQGTIEFATNNGTYVYFESCTPAGGTEQPDPDTTDYGTADAPLSVEAALALAAEQCVNSNDVTKQVVYAIGTVKDLGTFNGTYYSNFYLQDATNTALDILVYTINVRADVANPEVGDTVVICGYIKNYNGTLEFASSNGVYVYIEKNLSREKEEVKPDPLPEGTVATVDIGEYATANNWESGSENYLSVTLNDVVTATTTDPSGSGKNNGKYYESNKSWRLYKSESATLTLTVAAGYELVAVRITWAAGSFNEDITSGVVKEVSGSSVTFSVAANIQITKIEVVYKEAGNVEPVEPEYAFTTANLAVEGEKVLLTINGTSKGYTQEELAAKFTTFGFWGGSWTYPTATVVLADNGTFTLTVDVAAFGVGTYTTCENNSGTGDLKATVGENATVIANGKQYKLALNWEDTLELQVTEAPEEPEVPSASLTLTGENFTALTEGSGYATFNGTHEIGGYAIVSNQVMSNTYGGYTVLQFQAEKGSLKFSGEFTKITVVLASTYAWESANPLTIKVGGATLTANLVKTVDTETKVNNYELYLYTIEYTVAGTGVQEIEVLKETKGAAYALSIDFLVAGDIEEPDEPAEPEYAFTAANLAVEGDAVILTISGTYAGYTEAELQELYKDFNLCYDGTPNYNSVPLTATVSAANGKFTVTVDVTSLETYHYFICKDKSGSGDLPLLPFENSSVTFGGKTYTLEKGWNGCTGLAVEEAPEEPEVPSASLTLTGENFTALTEGSGYATFNGTHEIGGYAIVSNQVMSNTYGGYTVLQFQAEKGSLKFSGEFTKITVVLASTYAWESANPLTIKVGGATLTANLVKTVDTETKVNNYELYLYTIEYTVAGTGVQEIEVLKETKGAAYALSIEFLAEAGEESNGDVAAQAAEVAYFESKEY